MKNRGLKIVPIALLLIIVFSFSPFLSFFVPSVDASSSLVLRPKIEETDYWIMDGVREVPYIYLRDEAKKCYQVKTAFIGAEIYDTGIAIFYDLSMVEQRVKSETWELWGWDGKEWKIATLGSPITFSVVQNSTGVFISSTRATSKPYGTLTVIYSFLVGNPLKHWIFWTNGEALSQTVQVKQRWDVANFDICYIDTFNVLTNSSYVNSTGTYRASKFQFSSSVNPLVVFEDQSKMVGKLQPVSLDFSGKKAVYTFSNWTLATNQRLIIDPDTLTLRPNLDGTYSQFVEVPNAGFIWGDQVESNDFSAWTATVIDAGQSLTVEGTQPHHGSYDCKMVFDPTQASDNVYAYKDFTAGTVIYARAYIYVESHTTNGKYHIFGLWTGGNYANVICLTGTRALQQYWRDNAGGYNTVSATTLSTGEYHRIDLVIITSAAGEGELRVWLDGVEVEDLAHTGLTNSNWKASRVMIGEQAAFVVTTGAATVYWDCISVSSSPIGVEDRDALVSDQSDNTALQVTTSTTQKETLNLADSEDLGTINSVTAYARARYITGNGGEDEQFEIIWKLGATEITSGHLDTTSSFADYSDSRNKDPDGDAWTWTNVNALEIGSHASKLDAGEIIQFSEYWIVVYYTVAGIEYERTSSVTVTFVLAASKASEFGRATSQTVTFSLATSRLIELSRYIAQTISLALSVEGYREIVSSISQTIEFALSSSYLVELTRGISQTINFILSSSRAIEISRTISETITFIVSGAGWIGQELEAAIALVMSFVFGTMGFWGETSPASIGFAALAFILAIVAVTLAILSFGGRR